MNASLKDAGKLGRRTLVTVMLAAVVSALAVPAAMATPKGEFKVFEQCPIGTEGLKGCLVSRTESGQITIGSEEVPIINTQTLQGGFGNTEAGGKMPFFGAANGETFVKVGQKVPGGLLNIIKCNEIKGSGWIEVAARSTCEFYFENFFTGVTAVTELAKPANQIGLNETNLFIESGVGLSLPLKVKLENPFLGSECYIGSESSPVTLNLTTGTTAPKSPNTPIKGKLGTVGSKAEGQILTIKNNTLVDNNFSAPAASGCGGIFSFLVDPIVNAKLGLPAAEGKNTAIFNNTVEQAGHFAVEESE